jgi:hypothetical protein
LLLFTRLKLSLLFLMSSTSLLQLAKKPWTDAS